MNRISTSALLLSVALMAGGCNNVPQPQPTRIIGTHNRLPDGDAYNRAFEIESHHRHRHGQRDEAPDDNWTNYDRAETGDQPSRSRDTGSYPAHANGWRNSSHRGNSRALTAAPGHFDFYLLNLSWSPEFCHGHPSAPECAQHRAFTLHGLWPQNNDGTYPEDCSEAPGPASPSQYADLYPDAALLQHEWQMHGTCSALLPDQFLALARRANRSIQIPTELSNLRQPTTFTPAQLTALLTASNPAIPGSSIAISCGNNYLTAVEICLDKGLQPVSCSAVRSCRASQIRIPAPQSARPH